MNNSDEPSDTARKRYSVGVLYVHGMGQQASACPAFTGSYPPAAQ
jgi:hypothetical protein